MSTLFPNHNINLETGEVFCKRLNKPSGQFVEQGYHKCNIRDSYGNHYQKIHEVIIAEGLQLPKHMWMLDENGNRYIVDHILPVSNGGTDALNNLRLIPKSDNPKNEISRLNYSKKSKERWSKKDFKDKMKVLMKGKRLNRKDLSKTVIQYTLDGEFVKEWKSAAECSRNGFNKGHIAACCRGEEKQHKGYIWKYKKL